MQMNNLAPFALKRFLFSAEARAASHDLSASYCQPLVVEDLLAFDGAAAEQFHRTKLGYPDFGGSPYLREAITGLYTDVGADDCQVYAGGDDSILAFMTTWLSPGDHVIVQVPTYQSLYSLPQALGVDVELLELQETRGWTFQLADLIDRLRPNTRAVVLNLPQNPTGMSMALDDYLALFQLAEERGFVVFVDEIYRLLEQDPATTLPAAADCSAQGVSLGAMSKIFGLPGLRLGWLATRNSEVTARLAGLRDYHNSTISAPSEALAHLALTHKDRILADNRTRIDRNLVLLDAFMNRQGNRITWQRPGAGTMAFPRLADGLSSSTLTDRLLKDAGILLPSSRYFDHGDSHFRIGFATDHFADDLLALEDAIDQFGDRLFSDG
jgi:aspartate/methionine/tyrosine aminotransferase